MFSPTFIALQREAGIGAEMIGSGVTLLSKANSFSSGIYSQAFFNLTIGLERTAKLIVLLDYYFKNGHTFYDDGTLKKQYGHDLEKLLQAARQASSELVTEEMYKFPDTQLHKKFIAFLSEFAKTTRYYNLNLLTKTGVGQSDPIRTWSVDIGGMILKKYPMKQKSKTPDEIIELMEPHILVRGSAEDHSPIGSLRDAADNAHRSEHINKYGRLLALQITRAMAETLSELRMKAYTERADDIPDMNDFFRVYLNNDKFFLSRKTWKPI